MDYAAIDGWADNDQAQAEEAWWAGYEASEEGQRQRQQQQQEHEEAEWCEWHDAQQQQQQQQQQECEEAEWCEWHDAQQQQECEDKKAEAINATVATELEQAEDQLASVAAAAAAYGVELEIWLAENRAHLRG